MSTISTGGSDAPSTRAGSRRRGEQVHALGARRGRAGDEHRPGVARAPGGDAAGVVARVALVLVAGVVLLVDDDQAEVGQRREDRRAGAHADPRRPAAQAHPLVVALAVGELGVQDRDGVAEARDEARHDLRGQRDLGDEHEHRAPLLERRVRGVQVDLGLARARHALQQQQLAGLRRGDRLQRGGLVGGQRRRLALGADGHVRRRAAHGARLDGHQAAGLQAPQGGQVAAGEARQRLQQRALAVGEALAVVGVARGLRPRRRLRARALRRQQQAQRPCRRGAVVAGQPERELHQLRRQLRVEDLLGLGELVLAGCRRSR